ncbi:MAG TPA: replication-associated recombination protein A [Candidatus Caccovivens faecavium]|nr:replication-associated recombination protein A [Candidatus Caccovivens faecavium]
MDRLRVPLAERMRPKTLDEFFGQEHIVGKNKLLRRAIQTGSVGSMIFYGPPGTGKTTLAGIIAKMLDANIEKLNAVSSGVAEAKAVIERARTSKAMFNKDTYLLLDECHRWNKAQSDCVLQAIEEGSIYFIGSTTENPYTSMTRAIVSRCSVFEFKKLSEKDVLKVIERALTDRENGLGEIKIEMPDEAKRYLAFACNGDVRTALNALELAVKSTKMSKDKYIHITKGTMAECLNKRPLSIDENTYYDYLSAFCKSLRGSDTEAALYYSQRLIKAGIDPHIIARRMIAHASEDIGMADSNALLMACCAMYAVEKIGPPECYLNLSHAIIYLCEAEKSNSVYMAMSMAEQDAENEREDMVPNHLKNHPSTNADGHGKYKYPHNYGGYVKQQYMPDSLKDRVYYKPSANGKEKNLIRKKFSKNV